MLRIATLSVTACLVVSPAVQAASEGDAATCSRLAHDLLKGGAISVTARDADPHEARGSIRLVGAGGQ